MNQTTQTPVLIPNMPDDAQVWIYQAHVPLNGQALGIVHEKLGAFVAQWKAHGKPLRATYAVFYDQILVLAADNSIEQASGCSIDSSVACIKELGEALGINFFDRLQIAFLENGHLHTLPLAALKANIQSGYFSPETPIFNNSHNTLGQLRANWCIRAGDSFLARFF